MIQHLKIDSPPVLKSQIMLNLGRVNIITGRNSAGKSTVFRTIMEKPDIGITYNDSVEIEPLIRTHLIDYASPDRDSINDWVQKIIQTLNEKILFSSSRQEAKEIVTIAKNNSDVRSYSFETEIKNISDNLVNFGLEESPPVLLSPKRRIPFVTFANVTQKLDSDAINALSRLFFLKNQMPDSTDRCVFENIQSSFRDITGCEFDIQIRGISHPPEIQLQFRQQGGSWINALHEGLGLSEILTIILYSLDGDHKLLLIEEPENHLHPDLQRKLLLFLNSVKTKQFILSTHSPTFLNPTMVDRIFFCKYHEGEIIIDDNTSRAEALSQIGVLAIDNLTSDAVVISEGKTDQLIIDHIMSKWLCSNPKHSISHVFLSGSMMMYFDPTPFAQIRNTFALLDQDTGDSNAQKVFKRACAKVGIAPTQLSRYCIENYYTLEALRAEFGDIIPEDVVSINHQNPPWKQIADPRHNEKWWEGELKSARRIPRILNHMSIADIKRTDLLKFCQKIKSVL